MDLDNSGRPMTAVSFVDLDSRQVGRPERSTARVGLLRRPPTLTDTSRLEELDVTLVAAGSDVPLPPTCVAVSDVDAAASQLLQATDERAVAVAALTHLLRLSTRLEVETALLLESLTYSMLLGSEEYRTWRTQTPRTAPRTHPTESPAPVLLRRTDHALYLTLNRPDRHNAFNAALRDAFTEGLAVAEHDPHINRVFVTGNGPSFCSGGDLDEFGLDQDLGVSHLIRTHTHVGSRVDRLQAETRFAVHGACIGAGIEVPAFGDVLVADEGAWFQLPELRMGLIPGAGGTVSIPRRIGRWRTAFLALSGQPITAQTALHWGLLDALR